MIKEHKKSWGSETWLCNNNLYCGKLLNVERGKWCSYHFHKLKDETFYVLHGWVLLEYSLPGKPGRILQYLKEGESIRIQPFTPHRFIGFVDSVIIEISTQHFEEDSYRLEPSFVAPEPSPQTKEEAFGNLLKT